MFQKFKLIFCKTANDHEYTVFTTETYIQYENYDYLYLTSLPFIFISQKSTLKNKFYPC